MVIVGVANGAAVTFTIVVQYGVNDVALSRSLCPSVVAGKTEYYYCSSWLELLK